MSPPAPKEHPLGLGGDGRKLRHQEQRITQGVKVAPVGAHHRRVHEPHPARGSSSSIRAHAARHQFAFLPACTVAAFAACLRWVRRAPLPVAV